MERIKSLVIPPAWQDVWICPLANGTSRPSAWTPRPPAVPLPPGLAHPRDQAKFDRVIEDRPGARPGPCVVAEYLALEGMPLERAAATAVRLLDLG